MVMLPFVKKGLAGRKFKAKMRGSSHGSTRALVDVGARTPLCHRTLAGSGGAETQPIVRKNIYQADARSFDCGGKSQFLSLASSLRQQSYGIGQHKPK
jgi:hypothetical protein